MLWAFVRHGRTHPARYTHGTRGSVLLVVGSIALVALAVDGSLFVHTLHDMKHVFWNFAAADEPGAIRIEVTAHQWAWAVRYAGPDGKFDTEDDVVLLNDVRVPVGTPVIVQLASNDVIHSFNLPNLRVKQDAVPGMITRIRFQGQVPGEYEIACAQHCGPNHYKMRGVLTVLAPEAYRAWLATAEQDARRAFDPEDKDAHWGWEWRNE
jgi:cytochrome c oxidase subunit 2